MKKKTDMFTIVVDDVDKHIIAKALSDLRDKQRTLGKDTHCVDDVILKVCDALPLETDSKTKGKRNYYEER